MIEALKSDEIVHKMGGRFKLCYSGATPPGGADSRGYVRWSNARVVGDLEVIIEEILQGKIGIDREKSEAITAPAKAARAKRTDADDLK